MYKRKKLPARRHSIYQTQKQTCTKKVSMAAATIITTTTYGTNF